MDKIDELTRSRNIQNARERRAQLLIACVEAKTPASIPPEMREEMCSAIIADAVIRHISLRRLNEVLRAERIQEYRRGAQMNPFSHLSLDHLIGENLRLGDVLEG